MTYRALSEKEIKTLETQNCQAIDGWDQVKVSDNFKSSNIKNTTFSGENYLGLFDKTITIPSGGKDYKGIYNVHLHNCMIKDGCYIKNIGTSISNYIIEEDTIIQNVGTISVDMESSFGNGVVVSPINEAGGREVIIYNDLSVHTAYLMAFYQHNPKFIKQLKDTVGKYAETQKSTQGKIGANTIITNCKKITNINIGEYATLDGVDYLNNGSINCSEKSPTYIGTGVVLEDFIIHSDSKITNGAILKHCFVGQGCEIGDLYTAENSVFFANSQCLQGEACSIFAGPYTVTHHKSTLLIAGYYSFFNAGSGTNQSNHMYKLGPVHQGIIERGGKTGSGSYILWPAQIGAFTMILGHHYGNPDISSLPFSYLIEDGGKSVLMPGQNIFNVGVTRDVQKWPNRDQRKSKDTLDYIISEALNPYTVNKILDGIQVLKQLQEKASPQAKQLLYKNTQITLSSINRGIKLYEQALIKYIGDELLSILNKETFDNICNKSSLHIDESFVDLAGLICKTDILEDFIQKVDSKTNISEWNSFFQEQFNSYSEYKSIHILNVLKSYFGIDYTNCTKEDLASFMKLWQENNEKTKSAILIDAKKEFNVKSKIGFGIDHQADCRVKDFENVRGNFENNSFKKIVEEEYEETIAKYDLAMQKLTN
ncbi:DUF4954 family protein [Labilibacter marinus]|uniref:DUF4954 family protein n=1 Tax=Labilibacter marinus TaxID=1477105 RepID=UPI0008369D26|nr:DUF4954 family protein [Labilibacter marinus]